MKQSWRCSAGNNVILYPSVYRCCCLCFSMAVVIRLQGLRITAGSEDIRKFFTGLKIPDGGVHIIGGDREEAFIIFASDEDARRAMTRSGGVIQDSPVQLLLSSKAEMQTLLEKSTKNIEQNQERQLEDEPRRPQRFGDAEMGRGPGSKLGYTQPQGHHMASNNDDELCLFLKGLPFSVTEKEICEFFNGLCIDDIFLMKRPNGANNGKGFIKFATREDAMEGIKRDKEYIGTRYIEISPTTISDWRRTSGRMPFMRKMNNSFERGRSPVFSQRNPPERMRSRSPVAQRHTAPSDEYCVHLENLSFAAEKENLKGLFHKAKLEDDQIMHLFDSEGRRTRSTFILFKSPRDYCDALNLEKVQILDRWVHIRPISKENMISLLESQSKAVRPGNIERFQQRVLPYSSDSYDSENICVFVRNLPFDVRKVEIMDFFHEFSITEDKVCVLHDHKGAGVGKALVLFGSEPEAMRALSLNGRRFLGSEVILRSISRSQMQELIAEPPEVQELPLQEERFLGRSSEPYFHPGDTQYPDPRTHPEDIMPVRNVHGHNYGGFDFEPRAVRSCSPNESGNGVRHGFDSPARHCNVPTCVQLVNLPFQIKTHEIYDFCYGYRVIPGSVSLQYEPTGKPKGSATLVFQTREEAMTAIEELSGRPIGARKIQLLLV